jgi:hypothetical protein
MNGAEAAQEGSAGKTANDTAKVEILVYPTVENKQVTHDSSVLRIKNVSIKMNAFRQDLRIRGLHLSIGATVQKVKIWST